MHYFQIFCKVSEKTYDYFANLGKLSYFCRKKFCHCFINYEKTSTYLYTFAAHIDWC